MHRISRLASILALALLAGACGSGGGAIDAGPTAPSETEGAGADDGDTGVYRSDGESDGLVFETVEAVIDDEWPVRVTIPKGWHVENGTWGEIEVKIRDHDDEGWLGGEAGDETSIFTRMTLDADCDGTCEPNDWETRVNGADGWLTRQRAQADLLRDESLPGGWVVIEQDRRDLVVTVLRWNDDAPRYLECSVEIDEDDVALVDQFIDACAAAEPLWFDA